MSNFLILQYGMSAVYWEGCNSIISIRAVVCAIPEVDFVPYDGMYVAVDYVIRRDTHLDILSQIVLRCIC